MLSCTTLYSSSKGNAVFIRSAKKKILVDVGVAACHIERSLAAIGENPAELDAIFITHEHHDHIAGAGILSRRFDVPIYATPKLWQTYAEFGNIPDRNQTEYSYGLEIGDLTFSFFKTFHDAVQPVGLVIGDGRHTVAICTDTGKITPTMIKAMKDASICIFEANHDRKMLLNGGYPAYLKRRIASDEGHLSNADAGRALLEIIGDHTRHIVLAHLSEENNTPSLARDTVASMLDREGALDGIALQVAPAREPSQTIILK